MRLRQFPHMKYLQSPVHMSSGGSGVFISTSGSSHGRDPRRRACLCPRENLCHWRSAGSLQLRALPRKAFYYTRCRWRRWAICSCRAERGANQPLHRWIIPPCCTWFLSQYLFVFVVVVPFYLLSGAMPMLDSVNMWVAGCLIYHYRVVSCVA